MILAVSIMAAGWIWCWNLGVKTPDVISVCSSRQLEKDDYVHLQRQQLTNLQTAGCIRKRNGGLLPEGLHLKSIRNGGMKRHTVTPMDTQILLPGYWFKSNTISSFLYQTRGLHQQKETSHDLVHSPEMLPPSSWRMLFVHVRDKQTNWSHLLPLLISLRFNFSCLNYWWRHVQHWTGCMIL